MQYAQTLPLKDHEVVITFDDGPIPPYANAILDTLASQCVKATYFWSARWRRPIRRLFGASSMAAIPSARIAKVTPIVLSDLQRAASNARSIEVLHASTAHSAIQKRFHLFYGYRVSAEPLRSKNTLPPSHW